MFKQSTFPALLLGIMLGASSAAALAQASQDQATPTTTAEPIRTSAAVVGSDKPHATSAGKEVQVQGAVGDSARKAYGSLSQPNMHSVGRGPKGTTFENMDTNLSN